MSAAKRLRLPSAPWTRAYEAASARWAALPGWARWVGYALILVAALALPSIPGLGDIMAPGSSWERILFYPIAIYVLLALGLNVVVGYAGLLDLGFVAFFAIGAYTNAILGGTYGWGFWTVLPIGIALAMLAGLLLGSPTLRLRGDYLAIVTLGFGEIIRVTANNTEFLGGPRGINQIPRPPSVEGVDALTFSITDSKPYYYLAVAFITVFIVILKRLERSRVGRSWTALREDEDAAELMGVPTLKFKLWAFTVGAAVGGATGVLYASFQTAIRPTDFTFIVSATILAAVVLGGAGHIPGVILGAFLVAWLPELARDLNKYRVLAFGAALVLLMIFRPQGLWPSRLREAELKEGEGGIGRLGGEVGAVVTQEGL
ncbi:MAG: branched-chain amino acid ABC transporter permease [Actinomycetia bacterium]|jgi:branched-chain amino acid transport system permease protein|nr:branched-chain amino acid ABC transporter permease [Actinomycetes bacterium]